MMRDTERELREQIKVLEEANLALRRQLAEAGARARISAALDYMDEIASMHFEDATGQDLETDPRFAGAVQGYLDSQDEYIRETDPDRFAEMRYMGLI